MKKLFPALLLILALLLPAAGAEAAEVDLSIMPASIAYAQALAMQRDPAEYEGQMFRISDVFNYSEARGKDVIIVIDRTGCCETSIDFTCADDLVWPDDYPELYSRIVVVGRYEPDGDGAYILTDVVIEEP